CMSSRPRGGSASGLSFAPDLGYPGAMSTPAVSAAGGTGYIPVIAEHVVVTPGVCGGKPRIAGHRIKVAHVAAWHERAPLTYRDRGAAPRADARGRACGARVL